LNKLFGNKNVIDYEDFYIAINGSSKATKLSSHFRWIFNTGHLRKLLLDKFEADKNLGTFTNKELDTEATKTSMLEAKQGSPAEDKVLAKYSTDKFKIEWLKKEDFDANYLEVLGNSLYVKNGKKVMSQA